MIRRKVIDWVRTGKNLELLRNDNIELRRSVCGALRQARGECSGDCAKCKYEMDNNISRKELSEVFGVSDSVIYNWENGKTVVAYDDLLFYAQLAKIDINEIVVFME